jgi:ferredoxin
MGAGDLAFHYVCTRDEARELIGRGKEFWVSNCGCREQRGQCARSRIDVCLAFRREAAGSGSGTKQVTPAAVEEILREAEEKHLVSRPFRNEADRTETDGICFCCDDCCDYFLHPENRCDKGDLIEKTDADACTSCGDCVEVCYFGARQKPAYELVIDRERCYGCGLCVDVCPADCIEMAPRR